LTCIEELLIARSHLNGTIISGERNLLPQAIQLNPEEQELRHKLAELECLYILKITERRRILGLDHKEDKVTEDNDELEGSEI
jgi:hypothetical protein